MVESGGRNNLPVGLTKAAKRLHTNDRTGIETQDRLIESVDPAFAQGRINVADHLDTSLDGTADPGQYCTRAEGHIRGPVD